jgi:hypothetical protein
MIQAEFLRSLRVVNRLRSCSPSQILQLEFSLPTGVVDPENIIWQGGAMSLRWHLISNKHHPTCLWRRLADAQGRQVYASSWFLFACPVSCAAAYVKTAKAIWAQSVVPHPADDLICWVGGRSGLQENRFAPQALATQICDQWLASLRQCEAHQDRLTLLRSFGIFS